MKLDETYICSEYRLAKNKNAQIGILAELHDCQKQDIIEVLTRNGEITGIPNTIKPMKQKRRESVDWSVMDGEVERLAGEGLKIAEIAERLGISTQSIYDRRYYFNKKANKAILSHDEAPENAKKKNRPKTAPQPERPEEPAPNQNTVDLNALRTAIQLIKNSGFEVSATYDFGSDLFTVTACLNN